MVTSAIEAPATEAPPMVQPPINQSHPAHLSDEEWAVLSPEERKHKWYRDNTLRKKRVTEQARVNYPNSFPPLPIKTPDATEDPNPFIIVTKHNVYSQQNVSSFAAAA
jgi:hypothetical protein